MTPDERTTIPDPSALTTDALQREIRRSEELRNSELKGIKDVHVESIKGLEKTFGEKFSSIEGQFKLVEQQRVEQKKDTKDAVDAALTAQKEAVKEQTTSSDLAIAKSETATSKEIEALRKFVDDLKERVGAIENSGRGKREGIADFYPFIALLTSVGTLVYLVSRHI